jgi:predicted nucleic acid-binding protein
MFLLDANVISELRRPTKANPKVTAWADSVRQPALFLSVMTVATRNIADFRSMGVSVLNPWEA